jgi:hypothetical protein
MLTRSGLCAAILAGLFLGGCQAAPRQRPIKMGAVDKGPGSMEYARRQLEGRWALQRAQIMDASGQPTEWKAKGTLVLDAYGNLTVRGQLEDSATDPARRPPPEAIDYGGRIVIDADRQEFRLLDPDVKAPMSATTQQRLDPKQVRRYRIEGDLLTISLIGPNGQPTAVTVFRREP